MPKLTLPGEPAFTQPTPTPFWFFQIMSIKCPRSMFEHCQRQNGPLRVEKRGAKLNNLTSDFSTLVSRRVIIVKTLRLRVVACDCTFRGLVQSHPFGVCETGLKTRVGQKGHCSFFCVCPVLRKLRYLKKRLPLTILIVRVTTLSN